MTATNCPRCGRVFTKIKSPVCPACVKEDDKVFEVVREYVKENPDQSINEVSEQTEVPVKRIIQYIRDGRLEVSSGISADVGCAQCGKPIVSGRYCSKCALNIKTDLLHRPAVERKTTGKMHVGR
jgi:flagellar operon protein (TIGR03826 family)